MIRAEKPDAVVLATGGVPMRPKLPGIDNPTVIDAVDLLVRKASAGKKVLVAGGGMVQFLSGKKLPLITAMENACF